MSFSFKDERKVIIEGVVDRIDEEKPFITDKPFEPDVYMDDVLLPRVGMRVRITVEVLK